MPNADALGMVAKGSLGASFFLFPLPLSLALEVFLVVVLKIVVCHEWG